MELFQGADSLEIHRFLEAFPIGLMVHAVDGGLAYLNHAAKDLLGLSQVTSLTIKNFAALANLYVLDSELLYPKKRLPAVQALQGKRVCLEDLEIRQGGCRTILQARAAPVRDDCGQITHAVVILQDITDRAQAGTIARRYNQALEHQVYLRTTELEREILIRQHIETELRQNQIRFETLSEAVPGVIYSLVTRAGQMIAFEYVNQRITTLYEAPLQNIIQAPQAPILEQMHPSDRDGFLAELNRCTANFTIFSYEWRSQSPAGVQRWLQTHAQPERREGDEICWHGLLLDVTQRKQTELDLQHNVAHSKAMLRAIPDLIFRVNREGYYVACVRNNPAVNILPPDINVVGRHTTDFLPTEIAAKHLQVIQATLEAGTLQVFEQTLTVRERLQHEEVRMVPCSSDTVMVIIRDISDRKAAELALKQSEAEHRAIVNALPDLMFRVDREGYWLGYVCTNATIDCLPDNYDPKGHHIADHMPPAVVEQQLQKIQQAITTGKIQVFEQQIDVGDRIQHEEVRIMPQGKNEVLFIVRDITDRKTAELALKRSEAQNRAILAAIPDLMFRLRRDGTFLAYFKNEKTQDLLEKSGNPVGHSIFEYATRDEFYHSHVEQQMKAVHQVLATGEMLVYEQQLNIDDTVQYEEVRIVPSGEDEVLVIIQNIGDRKTAELALQQSEAQKKAILTAIPDLMFHLRRDGLILDYLSGTNFVDLLDSSESHIGENLLDYATTDEIAVHIHQKIDAMHRALETGEMQLYEQETVIGDSLQYEEVRVVPVNENEVLVMIRDISERKRIEAELRSANERLARLSLTDPLTKLANRRSLDEHLQREWKRAMRERQSLSFILFDLDYFKRFNDTYGHQLGDDCLRQVARATAGVISRSSDLIARYGGEEFAVILSNTDLKGAFIIAQRIRETILQLTIPHESSAVHDWVTASIGVSSITPPQDSLPNILIRQADQALYSAKQAGRNNCQCFISRPLEEDDR